MNNLRSVIISLDNIIFYLLASTNDCLFLSPICLNALQPLICRPAVHGRQKKKLVRMYDDRSICALWRKINNLNRLEFLSADFTQSDFKLRRDHLVYWRKTAKFRRNKNSSFCLVSSVNEVFLLNLKNSTMEVCKSSGSRYDLCIVDFLLALTSSTSVFINFVCVFVLMKKNSPNPLK